MVKVDARGDQCPIPVIKTKKAISALGGADTVEVLVDNEIAVQNVSKMAASLGAKASAEKLSDQEFRIRIEVSEAAKTASAADDKAPDCVTDSRGDFVVVVSSDRMGSGNDELGKVLIKGFIYAVSQLETLPKTMLFYNGGAKITTEGSDSLEDLKNLEAQGVKIMTCGTCLDYYGLKDKLQVGQVTNMYVIVETMASAGKIIRP